MLSVLLQSFVGIRNVPDFLVQLEQFGLLDAIIPFLLIFTIVFTVSKRVNILGENKGVHMILALSLALIVVVPHITGTYPEGQDVVKIINNALPNVSLLVVVIVAALILAGLFTPAGQMPFKGGFFALLSAGAIIYIFGLSAGWWNSIGWLGFLSNPDVQAVAIIVLVFALVIFLITSDNPLTSATNVSEGFRRMFGGLGGHP